MIVDGKNHQPWQAFAQSKLYSIFGSSIDVLEKDKLQQLITIFVKLIEQHFMEERQPLAFD
jgi:hypothetical protein